MQSTSLSSLGLSWNASDGPAYKPQEVDKIVREATSPSRGSESSNQGSRSLRSPVSELDMHIFSDSASDA